MLEKAIYLNSKKSWQDILQKLAHRHAPSPDTEEAVHKIIETVREKKDAALINYTSLFDCKNFVPPLKIGLEDIHNAANIIDTEDINIIHEAAENIRLFHAVQKQESWFITRPDGSILGQKISPVDRAGLYVPGGTGGNTPLISTLLMTAIPAQVAGVSSIAVITPPRNDGTVNPYILATAHILGLSEIYRVGSAWGIAALAYGTESIPKVDVIAGPGNIYVTIAKRLVQGHVGIDMLAGPSEILILADKNARADWIAADMLSQAEHDSLASAMCLVTDEKLAHNIIEELKKQCAALPRADMAEKSLNDWGIVAILPDMNEAVSLSNLIAPEHLEIMTDDPWNILPNIRNAGAIFMGGHTPEALGDYFAGPNHVLPTLGTARFSSALSVQTFTKRSSIIAASQEFSNTAGKAVARLARLEALEAHARSMEYRKRG